MNILLLGFAFALLLHAGARDRASRDYARFRSTDAIGRRVDARPGREQGRDSAAHDTAVAVETFDALNDTANFASFCADHGVPVANDPAMRGDIFGISVLCERGKIVAHIIEERTDRHFRIHDDANLVAARTRLVG